MGWSQEIFANVDWRELADSDQCIVVLDTHAAISHGRSTPPVWKMRTRLQLKHARNDDEDELLVVFGGVVSQAVRLTVVPDSGFSENKLYPS